MKKLATSDGLATAQCNRAMQPRNATAQCNRAISGGIAFTQTGLPSARICVSPSQAGTSANCRQPFPMSTEIFRTHAAKVQACARLLPICGQTTQTHAGVSRICAGITPICPGIISAYQKPPKTLYFSLSFRFQLSF